MISPAVCDLCESAAQVRWVEVEYQDEPAQLCTVCECTGLHELPQVLPTSHAQIPAVWGRLANALIDGHGQAYREQVEASLRGSTPEGGSYDSF